MATDRFSHMPDPHIEQIRQVQYNRKHTEYQYFPEEYFSGSDVTIYFGDTWVDDLSGFQFSLNEPVKPIHGYASYTWDAVARGQRLVQGQFRIAFKEAGYLHTILDHIASLGDKAKPRLAYLMGGETPPNWLAGVKDNVEDLLKRWHGNPNSKQPDKFVDEKYLDEFEWPVLKHIRLDAKMTDSKTKNTKNRKRQGLINGKHNHKAETYIGAISQLQSRLIELGYGWGPWLWTEGSKTGKPISWTTGSRPAASPQAIAKYKPKNPWYLVSETDSKNKSLNSKYYKNLHWVRELQKRMDDYPGKNKNLWMGDDDGKVRYDGSYGVRSAQGVIYFQDLAFIPSASRVKDGRHINQLIYDELRKGFAVTGTFDTPTRIAVMLFQAAKKLTVDGIVGPATRKALSPQATRKKKIVGASNYKPDNLFEPRAAIYEKEVWGRQSSADDDHKRRTFFNYRFKEKEYLRKHGFDIYITYGPYPEQVIKDKGQMASKLPSAKTGFNTTVKAIRNVQLTGVQQVLDVSGQPIEEIYSFIAKDLD